MKKVYFLMTLIRIAIGQNIFGQSTPEERAHHSAVYDPLLNGFVVFGGFVFKDGHPQQTGDVWAWNGKNWKEIANTGTKKIIAPLAFDQKRQRLLMFGGADTSGKEDGKLNVFDNNSWRILTDSPGMARGDAGLVYDRFAPGVPFEYYFLDKDFEILYNTEKRMGTVFGIFTMLSILVASLGLFGLVTYTAARRTKEIGVRKVLGASVNGIVLMLSREFIKLVMVAAVISFPLAWWCMNKWLEGYAYRISISWWVFGIAALAAMLIALFTVSFQAFKAAIANPVTSLRSE